MCSNDDDSDMLDIFLSAASEEFNDNTNKVLKDTDIFSSEVNSNIQSKPKAIQNSSSILTNTLNTGSIIHNGDTDSSDDEGNRNYEDAKYNEYGKGIKKLLNHSDNEASTSSTQNFYKKQRISWKTNSTPSDLTRPATIIQKPKTEIAGKQHIDVYSDPIFGLRIINPLISSITLQERMMNRDPVSFAQLSRYLQFKAKDKDWVVAGVIVNKSTVKTSQKGNQYLIWTLSDLKNDIKTVGMFLFGNAYHQLWKTAVGTVVGILNPNVLDRKEGTKDIACLSIDNAQKVMVFGTSKDLGTCRSVKKNGEKCTAIVNTSHCEFCIYHIKQEYQKCSVRSELQANFTGKGLIALRNKVLGKNEVFYAGKSYMAIPAKRNKKLEQKDNNRLQSLLGGINKNSNNIVKAKNKNAPKKIQAAARLEISLAQRLKDLELLKKLGGLTDNLENKNNFTVARSSDVSLEESKTTALDVIKKLKEKKVEEPKIFSAQFDLQCDLVNVEGKKTFTGKVSSNVTLEESKSTALGVISKLKAKQNSEVEKNLCGELSDVADDFFEADDFELNYDEDDDEQNKPREEPTNKKIKNGNNHNIDATVNKKDSHKLNTSIVKSPGITNRSHLNNSVQKTKEKKNHDENKSPTISANSQKPNDRSKSCTPKIFSTAVPTLSKFGTIDLNKPVTPKRPDRAKLNAIRFVQQNGPLKKKDPNNTKGSGKKKVIQEEEKIQLAPEKFEQINKLVESGVISDRFKKMMAATSSHVDLLEQRDDEEQEKYFKKQEVREQMEEKMATTFKVACKAVRCLRCKYTSFSASDYCKKENHPLKVFDAMKRFFKCGNCGNRTVSLEIIPTVACKNCGSGKWEKTGMMKEKIATAAHSLSIRGGEQKFVNSVATEANLNLMVPDND